MEPRSVPYNQRSRDSYPASTSSTVPPVQHRLERVRGDHSVGRTLHQRARSYRSRYKVRASCQSVLLCLRGRFAEPVRVLTEILNFARFLVHQSTLPNPSARTIPTVERHNRMVPGLTTFSVVRTTQSRRSAGTAWNARPPGRHSGPQGRGGEDPDRWEGSRLGTCPSRAGWRRPSSGSPNSRGATPFRRLGPHGPSAPHGMTQTPSLRRYP